MAVQTAVEQNQNPAGTCEQRRVPPIFVTGVWRCGATLLYLLLNQHPDIALLYESDLPLLWPMFRLPWERKKWVDKWEYWNASISRHDLDPTRLSSTVKSLAGAFEAAGCQYAAQRGKKRWGCKSPSYLYRLEQIAAEFPHAQFVVLWRDPQESCQSALNAAASGASGMWFARTGMNHRVILASKILKKQVDALLLKGASVYQIHYRDLVGDTQNTMRGVCEFLHVPFDPAVTGLRNADRSAVFKGAHHALARGDTILSSTNRHAALPPKLAGKIERYKALWKAESSDTWLLTRHFRESSSAKPTLWEQATDRLFHAGLLARDIAPQILFSILPLSAWQMYRGLRDKDAQWLHRQLTDK
jgi:hypothetical protein